MMVSDCLPRNLELQKEFLLLQEKSFLQHLRKVCTKHGILLIFDEVISGFRVGFEGAAGLYDIRPDILTFGKIIGGGMPVGAYAASKEIMENVAPVGTVYQAGTLSANPVALSAGIATLTELRKPGFYQSLETKTQTFTRRLQEHCNRQGHDVSFPSIGSIFWLSFSEKKAIRRMDEISEDSMKFFAPFYHALLERGVYIGPSGYEVGFVSAAHTNEDLQLAVRAICESLDVVFGS